MVYYRKISILVIIFFGMIYTKIRETWTQPPTTKVISDFLNLFYFQSRFRRWIVEIVCLLRV